MILPPRLLTEEITDWFDDNRLVPDVRRSCKGYDAECPRSPRITRGDPGGNRNTQLLTGQADATAVLLDGTVRLPL